MTRVEAEQLIQHLDNEARTAFRNGDSELGDRLFDTHDAIEKWLKDGMPGDDPPVDLSGFDLPSAEDVVSVADTGETDSQSDMSVSSTDSSQHMSAAQEFSDLDRLRRSAREAEERGDTAEANRLWRQVLEIDPDDVVAQKWLQQRAEIISDQAMRRKVIELRQKATSEVIGDLDDALRLAREILSTLDLSDKVQQEVQKLESQARDRRAELKALSGEIETAAGLGQLKEAISQIEAFINAGRFEFEDREGNIVSASDKLREYNQEYAAFCTQKTWEYLQRAELSLPAFPKAADQILHQAFQEFDGADPRARDELLRRRAEIGEVISRWDRTYELIVQGNLEGDPVKRLALFEQARLNYPAYENLSAVIEDARADAAYAIVLNIKNEINQAEFFLSDGQFQAAQETAKNARNRAKDMRGASDEMDKQLKRIDQLFLHIQEQHSAFVVEEQRIDRIETEITELISKARHQSFLRLFVASAEILDRIRILVSNIPETRQERWLADVTTLHLENQDAEIVWRVYSQARTHVFESEKGLQADNLREAIHLLENVLKYPPQGEIVIGIQQDAKELLNGIIVGKYLEEEDLDDVEKKLTAMMAQNLHNETVESSLGYVLAIKNLKNFVKESGETRVLARQEARGWYWSSLVSAVVFACLFIFSILYILFTQPANALSYLTPLYTFIPGILSAIFFKQYTEANRRLDHEQETMWQQVDEFQRKRFDEANIHLNEQTE